MNPRPIIASIVEGNGEETAFPELLRRIGRELFQVEIDAQKPHRVPRDQMTGAGCALHDAVRLQAGRVAGARGTVLVLADSDDDVPSDLQSTLQAKADAAAAGAAVALVAVREYEAWFLAAAGSLRAHRDVRDDALFQGDPERVRGAKEALGRLMTVKYREVRHQTSFSAVVDLDAAAARSSSFRALIEAVRYSVTRWQNTTDEEGH